MEAREARKLLEQVASGDVTVDQALARFQTAPFSDLGYAKVDHHRALAQGVSEVIYGEGKTAGQILGICRSMESAGQKRVLITRLDSQKAQALSPDLDLEYFELPRVGLIGGMPQPDGAGYVAVACAGTSDLYAAEEAALTAEALGSRVLRLYDVGVAGIHRLLAHSDEIARARAVVAVAGMEGALPSVVAGLAS